MDEDDPVSEEGMNHALASGIKRTRQMLCMPTVDDDMPLQLVRCALNWNVYFCMLDHCRMFATLKSLPKRLGTKEVHEDRREKLWPLLCRIGNRTAYLGSFL